MSVSASTFLLRAIFPFERELRTARVLREHFWCSFTFRTKNIHVSCLFPGASTFLLRSMFTRYSLSSQTCEPHAFFRKHFWCSSILKTNSLHSYHVCFCQHILAIVDILFRGRIGLLQQTITWYKRASSLLFPPWNVKTKRPQPVKLDLALF